MASITDVACEVISTYDGLDESVLTPFRERHFPAVVLIGPPGVGKSFVFERLGFPVIRGYSTPLQFFKLGFEFRNQPIIVDDAETLWEQKSGRMLLRSATEQTPVKTLQWNTANTQLDKEGIPRKYSTSSPLMIITNYPCFGGQREQNAFLDRVQVFRFEPTLIEIHKKAADWFWDQELYDFIGQRLVKIDKLTFRTYVRAWQQKQAGLNWQTSIESLYCGDAAAKTVLELEADTTLTAGERLKRFMDEFDACKQTYYNLRNKLRKQLDTKTIDIPQLTVLGTPPGQPQDDQTESPIGFGDVCFERSSDEIIELSRKYEDALAKKDFDEAERLRKEIARLENDSRENGSD